jgi:hypothetical protein
MKQIEIRAGHTYSNSRGRERKVLSRRDILLGYEIVKDGTFHNRMRGVAGTMTIRAFARWAKEDVTCEN